MRCHDVTDRLLAYVDGALSEQHATKIQTCASCREQHGAEVEMAFGGEHARAWSSDLTGLALGSREALSMLAHGGYHRIAQGSAAFGSTTYAVATVRSDQATPEPTP